MRLQRPELHGPFDVIGDVHGCLHELLALMTALGCAVHSSRSGLAVAAPPERTLVFVGDLALRGPETTAVLRLLMSMARAGQALCVAGNQDMNLLAALQGKVAPSTPSLRRALRQFDAEPAEFRAAAVRFLRHLPGHLVLDRGRLVIAHAGLPEPLHGAATARARALAVYGETTGEMDENGLPVRFNWAAQYHGHALVVFGHTPVAAPLWLNNTVNIDTGCVYGGCLTAFRYPERSLLAVPSHTVYAPARRRSLPGRSAATGTAPRCA